MAEEPLSLSSLLRRYRGRIGLTWFMVATDALLLLLFPLAIGRAVDGYIEQSWAGLWLLIGLSLGLLVVGAARRFYDTRVYARIYTEIAPDLVERERRQGSSVSTITARTGLATEFVEYLEHSFPLLFQGLLGLVGTLTIILFLQWKVFLVALAASLGIAIIFLLSRKATYRFNQGYNSVFEDRVRVVAEEQDGASIREHFRSIMKWNIRLSDLETRNYSLSWALLIGVIVFAIIEPIRSGETSHGAILALVMYVFSFMENVLEIPYYYQQYVRLEEIT